MRTAFSILYILLIISAPACKKDRSEDPPSRLSLLTAAPWVMSKNEMTYNGITTDILPFQDPCERDDRWIFKTNRSLELNEGPSACDLSMPPYSIIDELRWTFTDNEAGIIIDGQQLVIDQLNQGSLQLSVSDPVAGSMRLSFVHP